MDDLGAWSYGPFLDLSPSISLHLLHQSRDFVTCSPTIFEGLRLNDTSLENLWWGDEPVNDRPILVLDFTSVFHVVL
jgi:hypothetical protein